MENGSPTSDHGADASDATGSGYKQSQSGPTGILSRLPFLRSSGSFEGNTRPEIAKANGGLRSHRTWVQQEPASPALASALQAQKSRKRKGSLRKTALLGTGKLKLERRSSNLDVHKPSSGPRSSARARKAGEYSRDNRGAADESTDSETTARQRYSFEDDITLADSETTEASNWAGRQEDLEDGLKIDAGNNGEESRISPPIVQTSPIGNMRYASTTDDDDGLTFSTASVVTTEPVRRKSSRSAHAKPASTQHSPPAPPIATRSTPSDHDYSTTAYWGWIILVITWVAFVVGMGSCIGVWSWAWDVGETPYAPPELEDDPTLPIVGYYPALIVMTGVMAWVWVAFAWVGMKYFRHARYGEE